MDTTYVRVAGLDVHHKTVQCAVRCQESGKVFAQSRSFGAMTCHLRALADYLGSHGITDLYQGEERSEPSSPALIRF
jgi:hypothetical protein